MLMAVEIDQVQAFVAIVRGGGFTRAASILHLSQPAVSRRLDLLERELGAPLFERIRSGVILTEAGRAFLPRSDAFYDPYPWSLQNRLAAWGLSPAEIIPIDSLTAQKRMVEAGFGLALLPESSVDEELRTGTLRAMRISGTRVTIPVLLIHRRRAYLSGAARALMAELAAWPSRQTLPRGVNGSGRRLPRGARKTAGRRG